jgi:hypothetical protein
MNGECRMTNDETMRAAPFLHHSPFAASGFTRHSKFVIRNFALLALLFASPALHACAVCFGNSDSKLSQGMLAGVLVLLLVVLSVLGGFVALFIYLARRAAAVAALEIQSTESKAS